MIYVFQLIPVIMAIAVFYASIKRLLTEQRYIDRVLAIHALIASVILLLAQSVWWWMEYHNYDYAALWEPNSLWLLFDAVVMSCFIFMLTYRR